MSSLLWTQVFYLGRRSVLRTLRQPGLIIPSLLFPMLLLAVNSGGLDAATRLPGFPTDSYLQFAFTIPFIQGALFAATAAGTDLARDIETGFLDRLALTPTSRVALLAGQLAGALMLVLLQSVVYLIVGAVAGVEIEAGLAGVLVLVLLALLLGLAFGAIGAVMALRTGSGEAVQGLFPLLFVTLFLSSMNLPRDLIETDWFRWVATVNPMSYLIEGVRSLIITGWDARALALGFGIGTALVALGLLGASTALRNRMAN